MTYFLIINPKAKGGRSRKLTDSIFSRLDASRIAYEFKIIDDISEAVEYSSLANKKGYDVIVAVGGDGTIRAVMNGFYDDEGRRISTSAMGIIYTGTSPDFCKSYQIPLNIDDAIHTLLNNHRQQIAVGKIVFSEQNNNSLTDLAITNCKITKTEYFGCCANIGIGSRVARIANSGIRKYLGDFLGTFISLISSILKFHPSDQSVVLNGVPCSISKLYNLSIGKTRYIASGIKVFNQLNPDSKQLYCIVARDFTLLRLPGILKNAYSGKRFKNSERFYLEYIEQIEIQGNCENPEIELDGDPSGYLPCKIEIAKDYLTLVTNEREMA
ncbi:diacylglycerol/lipid kinase family protein [Mangrovibacterium lignilyticum]|uniref:diacylglycerol/lipid kinase family protein n=1 Tax=Mangrovibacterium lignilyticum TaxID=2668052 RepID=UPI0013D168DF|nr:diacylglycerol kinase family protein [Mangrovibacterium lignilyticum]